MSAPRKFNFTLKEIVEPSHTAVVVFDTQVGLVKTLFNKDDFVKNVKSFLAVARKIGIPVLYTQLSPMPKGFENPWRIFSLMRRYNVDSPDKLPTVLVPGNPAWEIQPEVGPQTGEVVVPKFTPSMFIATNFENLMHNRGITTILFTGLATEIGIAASAVDSSNRGFFTLVVADCVSSFTKEDHEWGLKTLKNTCMVVSSDQIAAEWK